MPNQEPRSHTFLIRIWIEEIPEQVGRLSWRGHITHLPDEERRYVQTFEEIARFIQGCAAPPWPPAPSESRPAGEHEHTAKPAR